MSSKIRICRNSTLAMHHFLISVRNCPSFTRQLTIPFRFYPLRVRFILDLYLYRKHDFNIICSFKSTVHIHIMRMNHDRCASNTVTSITDNVKYFVLHDRFHPFIILKINSNCQNGSSGQVTPQSAREEENV